jgi:hypothetical protein
MNRAIWTAVITSLCGIAFLGGLAVGQSTAPPMTLEQHDKLMTSLNQDTTLYVQQEAIQKKWSDGCTAQMNQDPEYKSVAERKEKTDADVRQQVTELTKGVDPKMWILNMTTGHFDKPQTEKK